ncbi:MAG: molybdopterin-binding/glycosyltransferase family 2 protein [Pseudomonadota bacterium]
MEFGPVPVSDAEGAILAHSLKQPGFGLKKGHLLSGNDVSRLQQAGFDEVIVARLEDGDVVEDDAATRIAGAVATSQIEVEPAFTGRVNLFAKSAGLFTADPELIDAINAVDPGITIATLDNNLAVAAGRMVATVKIIPFAVSQTSLERVLSLCGNSTVMELKAFVPKSIGLIATELPVLKPSVMDKTRRVLEERLEFAGSALRTEERVAHHADDVAVAMKAMVDQHDMLIIFGASAIVDRRDVIPSAIEQAGGVVHQFGMPVDPGNLLLVGEYQGKPVIGAPGCARSPRENGFDFVLHRLLSGVPATTNIIQKMGVGGLLMEIHSRPQPRQGISSSEESETDVAIVVLAAGLSSRMGANNKLLAPVSGKPMVRHVVEAAVASRASSVRVVLGHEADTVRAALYGLDVTFVDNPDYASGIASSVKTAVAANSGADAVLVMLGDMPFVSSGHINRILDEAKKAEGDPIILATHQGRRGNPVYWPAAYFEDIAGLQGDEGARSIILANKDQIVEVELGDAASLDFDTPEALAGLK